ncbi:hypothetical protein BC629DRAFT_1581681 [Irpex lacteus]|nr:hypothetical protein BC629DRAFT_1581681 [Irpex lacteus]
MATCTGKTKGKELLYRYNGEILEEGEDEPVPWEHKRATSLRPLRQNFIEVNYEYDANSCGPAPPEAVLIMNISPLTSNSTIRRHFRLYGDCLSFEPQINKATGASLGIVWIRFCSNAIAKRCVEKENGKKGATGLGNDVLIQEGEELRVVLDGEGKLMAAVLKEMEASQRREKDEKERKRKEEERKKLDSFRNTPNSSHTPSSSREPWRGSSYAPNQSSRSTPLPRPNGTIKHPLPPMPAPSVTASAFPSDNDTPQPPAYVKRPLALIRARWQTSQAGPSSRPFDRDDEGSATPASRSPSPVSRRPGGFSRTARQREHEVVVAELAKNGFDYVTLEGHGGHLSGAVREEDVRFFFKDFEVDKVLQDHTGWYVTFRKDDAARRSAIFLNSGTRTLAQHSVNVTIHAAPAFPRALTKTRWTDSELVEQAEKTIMKDLKAMLEKDVMERIVGAEFRRIYAQEKERRRTQSGGSVDSKDGVKRDIDSLDKMGLHVATNLKGLSFRKETKRTVEEPKVASVPPMSPATYEEEAENDERPKKKSRKLPPKLVQDEDVESEDEVSAPVTPAIVEEVPPRKRAASVLSEVEEPVPKKVKKATKKTKKRAAEAEPLEEVVHEVLPDAFDVPAVAQVNLTPPHEPSFSPQPSPLVSVKPLPPRKPSPPPAVDPFEQGICEDDEDMYFVKLALSGVSPTDRRSPSPAHDQESEDGPTPTPFRVHVTGSARTEGYYKISHAEKAAYVAQYANRNAVADTVAVEEEVVQQPKTITSSRSNRANARRRAQGLEEINQVQRAMALSKGESAATELVKFNQLQTRKKHLRFARSPIHDWGLYAMEKISRGRWRMNGRGSGVVIFFELMRIWWWMLRRRGILGMRLINHSCDPNCTAKIITINGEKKIVIYAKQDIELGSEITYDYHFPIEQDKIPCLCGSAKCRGYLN